MADVSKDQGGLPNGRPLLRPFSGHGSGGPGALRPLGVRRLAVSPPSDPRSTEEHLVPRPSGGTPSAVAPQEGVVSGTTAHDAAVTGENTASELIEVVLIGTVGEDSSSHINDVEAPAEVSPHPFAASESSAPSLLDVASMLARQTEDVTFDRTVEGEVLDSPFRNGDPLAATLDGEHDEGEQQLVVNFVEFPEAGSEREALLAGLEWTEPANDREEIDNAAFGAVSSSHVIDPGPPHDVPSGEGEALQLGIPAESDEQDVGGSWLDADRVDLVAPLASSPGPLAEPTHSSSNDSLVVSDDDYAMVDIDLHGPHEQRTPHPQQTSHEQLHSDELHEPNELHELCEHRESDDLHEVHASGERYEPQEPTWSELFAETRQSSEGSSLTTGEADGEAGCLHEPEPATDLLFFDDSGGVTSANASDSDEALEPLVAMSYATRPDDALSHRAVDGPWPGTDLVDRAADEAVGQDAVGDRGQREHPDAVTKDEDGEDGTTGLVGDGVGEGADTRASAAPRTEPSPELAPVAELSDVLDAELAGFHLLPSEEMTPPAPILDIDALMRDEEGEADGSAASGPGDAGSDEVVSVAGHESMAAADSGVVTPLVNDEGSDTSAERGALDREEPRGAIAATERLEQGDAELQDFLLRSRSQAHILSTLEMVARRVRGGEIVPTIDAGSSPEAVLASVLASLLSPRT